MRFFTKLFLAIVFTCTISQAQFLYRASNPMTTLGDTICGGASGVPTRLAGPTGAASTTYFFTVTTNSSSVAQACAWLSPSTARAAQGAAASGANSDITSMSGLTTAIPPVVCTGGGTANAQTVTCSPSVTLATGLIISWLPTATNTLSTVTLSVNGSATANIVECKDLRGLSSSDLVTSAYTWAVYDGAHFQLLNPYTSVCGSSYQGGGFTMNGQNVNGVNQLSAGTIYAGTLYTAAGTALPACNSGNRGLSAVVGDATLPTYMGAYTSGGAIIAAVICSYNGTTYSWLTH